MLGGIKKMPFIGLFIETREQQSIINESHFFMLKSFPYNLLIYLAGFAEKENYCLSVSYPSL